MSTEEAIEQLRVDPAYETLIWYSYLGPDTLDASERFRRSAEFEESVALLGGVAGKEIVDLGAGTGIASLALARAGAARVYALEPDPSEVVGRGAIARLPAEAALEILDGFGERIPLADASVDIVYARQVLHHARDLDAVTQEVKRVLRHGGLFLACREHVVDDAEELARFLAEHPVHRLAGGEGAHTLKAYLDSMRGAGLRVKEVWGLYDTVINAFPFVQSSEELKQFRREALGPKLARLGRLANKFPRSSELVRERLAQHTPAGRMYSFLAKRP